MVQVELLWMVLLLHQARPAVPIPSGQMQATVRPPKALQLELPALSLVVLLSAVQRWLWSHAATARRDLAIAEPVQPQTHNGCLVLMETETVEAATRAVKGAAFKQRKYLLLWGQRTHWDGINDEFSGFMISSGTLYPFWDHLVLYPRRSAPMALSHTLLSYLLSSFFANVIYQPTSSHSRTKPTANPIYFPASIRIWAHWYFWKLHLAKAMIFAAVLFVLRRGVFWAVLEGLQRRSLSVANSYEHQPLFFSLIQFFFDTKSVFSLSAKDEPWRELGDENGVLFYIF
jgi:hypothetical protein